MNPQQVPDFPPVPPPRLRDRAWWPWLTRGVLVLFGEKRLTDPLYKDVPTAREKGFDVVVTLWQGFGAPRNMPDAIRNRLADALGKAITSPEGQEAIRNLGLEPAYLGPAEFGRKWIQEHNAFRQVVTDTGILQTIKSQTK